MIRVGDIFKLDNSDSDPPYSYFLCVKSIEANKYHVDWVAFNKVAGTAYSSDLGEPFEHADFSENGYVKCNVTIDQFNMLFRIFQCPD